MGLKLYIATHHHEFGTDVRLFFADHWPESVETAEALGIDFEPDAGEDLEVMRYEGSERIPVIRSWTKGPKALPLRILGLSGREVTKRYAKSK